ncbi:efflux transporter outer membrane subunit [Sphingomonas sp. BIUV-7]|uniref:Efflux transporter outer membrane subunit n=1 Tax=Sphingomonas natans TaxID=3063330 RepID=A0ABT8Y4K0_9SPHN|nr:efflux transporter outer membrane subunit [Sphingomonas sp. BIUV-7]MDO6413239.1 efflux transporter outer membrane subunit [Sphingomonas sp. BIUV-7]
MAVRARIFASAATALLLAGCSFAPAYRPAATPTPAAFKEDQPVPPAGWAAAAPQDMATRGAWWTVFADPVLDDLEARAERASPTLAAAISRYDAARAEVREAKADLYPQVDASAQIRRERLSGDRPVALSGSAEYTQRLVGASARYELDLWGRIRNEVSARGAEAQASRADLGNVRLSLQADLADAYLRLRGLDAEKQLLERTVVAYTRARDLTQTRHDGGVANGLDVSRSRTILSSARAQLSDVANSRAALEHQIAALIGELPSTFALAADVKPFAPPILPAAPPSELLQRRPDVAQAERSAYAANRRIGVARAAWFPTLSLGAQGGYNSVRSDVISSPASFWTLGPAMLVQTIFDGGRRAAQVRISRAEYETAAADYRGTVLTAFREAEDSLAGARLLAQASVDQRDAAEAAARTEQLALIRYRDGASDYLDVVTAQTAALDAERSALQVQTRRMQAAVALVRAFGGDYRDGAPPAQPAQP